MTTRTAKNITHEALKLFIEEVDSAHRYVLGENGTKLCDFIKGTIANREKILPPMTDFYRAQKGFSDERSKENSKLLKAHSLKRMIPLPQESKEGRVNPKGIPCLYLADGPSPAIYEMRPCIGEIISVAHFISSKSCRIIDLTSDNEDSIQIKKLFHRDMPTNATEIERQIWSDLNRAFSKPVSNDSDTLAPYAATQIIAEWFKSWGYNGLKFKSSIHPTGNNFALFDINTFNEMESCELHTIDSVKYERHGTNDEFTRYCDRIKANEL